MNDFVPDPTRPQYGEWLYGFINGLKQAWMQRAGSGPPPAPAWKLPPPPTVPPSVAVTPTGVTLTVNEWPKQPWVDEMAAYYANAVPEQAVEVEIGIRAAADPAGQFNGDWLPGDVSVAAPPNNLAAFPATPYSPPTQAPRDTPPPTAGDYVYTLTLVNKETQVYEDWWVSPPFPYPLPAAVAAPAPPPAPKKAPRKRKGAQ